MRTKTSERIVGWGISMALIFSLCSCGGEQSRSGEYHTAEGSETERDEDAPMTGNAGENADEGRMEQGAVAFTDFGVRLLQSTFRDEENVLISPLSVILALGMTANGAKGETLSQMEDAFGISREEWNTFLRDYRKALPQGDKYKLSLANALWITADERFSVEQEFLQNNADYYEAQVHRAIFDDTALKEMNEWVEKSTDGMVKNILDRVDENAVMYLVNALAFDAQWQERYKENQIQKEEFTSEDQSIAQVEMMYSEESQYLEDEQAAGFLKYYADGKYAFAALLPNEGVSVREYTESLTGASLRKILAQSQEKRVQAAIPRFQSEYSVELKEALQGMGIQDAFDEDKADFSALGYSAEENIFVSRVIHKTNITVDANGTKAGAATVVEMEDGCGGMEPEEVKIVYLNRPFVYMLIDCETKLPVFLGTVMDVGE